MHTMLRLALACVAVLSSTPGMAQTPLERGVAAVEAERFQEAIAILTQALTDDFDGAEASFRSALELTPDYAEAKQGLAAVNKLRAERTGGASASRSQSAQPPAGSSTAATSAKPASANCKVAGVQLGVDTVAGGGGLARYRVSSFSGGYADVGPDVMTVNYDFDAAGPARRLVAVTIVNKANSGPGYETLLASRKAAAAAIAGPLQQKSATELVASGPGCQLRLLPNADTWFIHDVYQLPN